MVRTSLMCALLAVVASAVPLRTAAVQPDAAARADEYGQRILAAGKAPGFAVAVVRGGTIVYAKGFGLQDIAAARPVTPDTIFAVGSVSKQFTAAAVLLLVQDKKLRLDDRVAQFEPSIPNANELTLRELLNQTSGLHNYADPAEHAWPLQGAIPLQRIIDILATDKPDFTPGTRFEYSNANYAVLTAAVERAGGRPMGAFLSSRIFGPLRMTRSGFGYADQQRLDVARAYRGVKTFTEQDRISADLFSGAGAVLASAADVARWDAALLAHRLLDARSRDLMFAPGTLKDGTPTQYGMGFVPGKLGAHRMIWHNGLAPGVGGYCFNAVFPDDDLAIVVLSNGYDFSGEPERLTGRLFETFSTS
jgi:D-alanyl-D-alanine carboxypeptidase